VRIAECKEHDALKGHQCTFLKNREKLSDKKEKELAELIKRYPTLGEAHRLEPVYDLLASYFSKSHWVKKHHMHK